MPPLIIWDVDGTLVDTAEQHFAAWVRFSAELGVPYDRPTFDATFGHRNPEIFQARFFPNASADLCRVLGEYKESLYRAAIAELPVPLLPGAGECIRTFASLGWPQAIGSSAPRANLDQLFAKAGLTEAFVRIVSGDDVNRGKPAPDVFLAAAVGLAPVERCIVFEDAVAGVQAAKAAGMTCIGVVFANHNTPAALRIAGADLVVESLEAMTSEIVLSLIEEGL